MVCRITEVSNAVLNCG